MKRGENRGELSPAAHPEQLEDLVLAQAGAWFKSHGVSEILTPAACGAD